MNQESGLLRDQLSIDTPELVVLRFPLAGIGSRFVALMVDGVLQGIVLALVVFLIGALLFSLGHFAHNPANWVLAVMILTIFLVQWGYFTLFEAFLDGQTPGKRLAGIRVIQQSGRPVGFFESLARNLVRFIDVLPGFYGVGLVSIFLTQKQQRLGDLVAGTLVVHDREVETPLANAGSTRTFTASLQPAITATEPAKSSGVPADRLARLSGKDLEVIENFLARRLDLPLDVRERLAQRIVAEMTTRMDCTKAQDLSDETFLEGLAHDRREI